MSLTLFLLFLLVQVEITIIFASHLKKICTILQWKILFTKFSSSFKERVCSGFVRITYGLKQQVSNYRQLLV